MSLIHLLGIGDDLSFDGKGLDKTVDNIKGYANNKFSEDEIDSANGALEDILSCAESIDNLENISNNVDNLVESTDNLVSDLSSVYKKLDAIKQFIDVYYVLNDKENDDLDFIYTETVDALDELGRRLQFKIKIEDNFTDKFITYIDFDFMPDSAILSRSDKSGQVCYVSGDWEFELSTYIGYGGLRMTPKAIRFKHLDFCKAYDKIVEIGLDPKNLSVEDVQLLKIVDNRNSLIYDLFVKQFKGD